MTLDRERCEFLISPVMIILGACGPGRSLEIGRGVGARVPANAQEIDIIVSSWQWRGLIDNAVASGRVAATFARPSDYISLQVKGRVTRRPARAEDIALADHYIASMSATLVSLGLAPTAVAQWLSSRDAVVLKIAVDEMFDQTPGSGAGRTLAAAS